MSVVDMDLKKLLQELEDYQTLTESLREQLERAHKENSTLIDDNNFVHRKITSIKQELSNNHNEYSRLENELYQANQELERLKKENLQYLKNKREVERKLREETQSYEKDKILWLERESELIDQSKALQETLNVLAQQSEQSLQKKDEILSANHYSNARELRNANKQIKELEHKVGELESELIKSKQASTESINLNKNHVRKIQQLENEISQIKHMNHTLMEDNESYQLLLHEKTIKGDFIMNPILQSDDYYTKHTDKAEKVTDNITKDDDDKDSQKSRDSLKSENSSFKNKFINNSDLSSELDRAKALTITLQGENVYKESGHTIVENEIKTLRDANKSMQLYIQKILNRIMEAKGFEELLSSDWTAGFNDDQNEKKIERRKTLSDFHARANSQPQNNYNSGCDNKVITEEPESLSPDGHHKELVLTKGLSAPKRPQRSKSISHTKNNATNTNNHSKRFSIFDWVGVGKESNKKDDPYMKPIMLLKENTKN